MMINYVDYEMADGSKVQLSLGMAQLFKLKSKNKKAFERVNAVLMSGPKDVINFAELVYGAYLCANDDAPSFEEFLEIMNQDPEINAGVTLELRGLGKKRGSAKPS